MSIHDFIKQNLNVQTLRSEYLCRFRTFILNFSTFTSAWILVLISIDRLVRISFPHHQRKLCMPKVAALLVGMVCICSIASTSHVLQSEFAFISPFINLCGVTQSTSTSYRIFYFNIWPILQLLITYFVPTCGMLICVICIRLKIHEQQNRLRRSIRRERLDQQMFILLISSIICFAFYTLPYSIHRIIYLRFGITSTTTIEIAVLTIFLNMNYCYNFYIHCLTSNLFRQKFIEQFRCLILCCKRRTNNRIQTLPTINGAQN